MSFNAGEKLITSLSPKRFPALASRDFRVLWIGMVCASGTMAFQYYAQMWLVYSLTESAWVVGSLGAVRGVATILFGLFGGALADRMDRRWLLLVTRSIAVLAALALGLMVVLGGESLWMIFLLIFVGAVASSIDAPIRQALIPELVEPSHIPNAVALTTAAYMGSFAVTPVLAGFVIAEMGAGGAYLLSALGEVAIIIALLRLHYRGEPRSARHESVRRTIIDGVRYTRTQKTVLWVILLSFVTSAFGFSLFMGLIAKWAGDVLALGADQYGWLAASWGLGTLLASWFMSWKGDIKSYGSFFLWGSILFSVSFLLFSLTRAIPLVGLIYVVNGAAWTCASISATAIIQKLITNDVRGRVMSLFMLSGAVAQANSLSLGLAADTLGLETLMFLTTAFCSFVTILLIVTVPQLRRLGAEH